jgi:hypothetical protein
VDGTVRKRGINEFEEQRIPSRYLIKDIECWPFGDSAAPALGSSAIILFFALAKFHNEATPLTFCVSTSLRNSGWW